MKRDIKILKSTYTHSFKSQHKIPVSASICIGSRILNQGCNIPRSHPLQKNQYIRNEYSQSHSHSTHAELSVIDMNFKYNKKYSLYICRRKKDNSLGLSLPCSVCMDLIKKSGIGKIVYSISGTINKPHYGVIVL